MIGSILGYIPCVYLQSPYGQINGNTRNNVVGVINFRCVFFWHFFARFYQAYYSVNVTIIDIIIAKCSTKVRNHILSYYIIVAHLTTPDIRRYVQNCSCANKVMLLQVKRSSDMRGLGLSSGHSFFWGCSTIQTVMNDTVEAGQYKILATNNIRMYWLPYSILWSTSTAHIRAMSGQKWKLNEVV